MMIMVIMVESHWKRKDSENRSVVSNSLWSHRLYSPWNSPGQNTGVDSHSLLQGIFLTQGSNSSLLQCRQILYHLSYRGSPYSWLNFTSYFQGMLWLVISYRPQSGVQYYLGKGKRSLQKGLGSTAVRNSVETLRSISHFLSDREDIK